jgi:putative peptidoglycan lipid II flippase
MLQKIRHYLFGTVFRAGASVLTTLTLASYALGLVRDMLFSRFLGASRLLDVYNAAFVIPDVLLNVFVAGALTAAFVPVFSHLRAQGDNEESERVATTMFAAAPGAMLAIGIIAFVFMPALAHIVAPGFSPDELVLLIRMSRLMLVSPILFALSNTFGSVLVSLERFVGYGLSPILYNLGIIGGVFLAQRLGPIGLVIGTVAGAALHLGARLVSVIRSHLKLRGPIDLSNTNFRQILKLMIPRMAGQPIEQLTFSLFTSLASTLAVGSIAVVSFARNFQSVPISVFGISFSTAVFASLSRKAAIREREGFLYHLRETAKPLAIVSVLSALFYIFFGTWIVGLLLGGGKFGSDAVIRTGHLLALFALAIPAESFIHLLVRAFYALKDTWTPILVSVPGLVLIWILSKLLMPSLGLNALGVAYFLSQTAEVLILWLLLQRHLRNLHA